MSSMDSPVTCGRAAVDVFREGDVYGRVRRA
jgi:hypothetical protein